VVSHLVIAILKGHIVMLKKTLVLVLLVMVAGGCTQTHRIGGRQQASLFVELPSYCPTPDAMAIAPNGDLVVTCPNFADQQQKAWIIRIDRDRNVHPWVEVPPMALTGVACPMGLAFGPDGDVYLVDNQGWMGTPQGQFQGRILRLRIRNGRVERLTEIATGMEHPNGIRYRNGHLYVTQSLMTKVEDPSGLLVSGVYRFRANDANIRVSNTREDANLIATFVTENRHCQYGVDGLDFDSKGRLFVGNFGDGTLHKLAFDADGNVVSNTVFARTNFDYALDPEEPGFLKKATRTRMRTVDGIVIDGNDNIYVADFSNNAVAKVTPDGRITVLAQNGDTDGRNGELNQPAEPIVWSGKLIVTNLNLVTGPDKVNTAHTKPFTISELKLQ
jgi:sugar lactone lactonase YvrE